MISLRSIAGRPIPLGTTSLIPVARWHRLRWPGGGLVWATPLEVVVQEPGRGPRVWPVADVTRRAQIALLVIGAAAALLLRARERTRTRRRR